jgi:hypothetical protein
MNMQSTLVKRKGRDGMGSKLLKRKRRNSMGSRPLERKGRDGKWEVSNGGDSHHEWLK